MANQTKCWGLATAAVVFVAGGAVAAGAGGSGSPSLPTQTVTADVNAQTPAAPARPEAQRIDPALSSSFSVLRGSNPHPSPPPPSVTSGDAGGQFGANPSLARKVTVADGRELYVIPGSNAVCVSDDHSGTCNSGEDATQGHLVNVELCGPNLLAGHVQLFGLMPDGVKVVTVVLSGSQVTSAVVDNVYFGETQGAPSAIRWSDAKGTHSEALPIPPDYDPAECSAVTGSAAALH